MTNPNSGQKKFRWNLSFYDSKVSFQVFDLCFFLPFSKPIGSMYGIFTYISTIHVGKYISPMDPMGNGGSSLLWNKKNWLKPQRCSFLWIGETNESQGAVA